MHTGTIDLIADFGAGSVTGRTGALNGIIKIDRAVAVFHGNDDALVYVGVFDVVPVT